jgi:hypothetical protein
LKRAIALDPAFAVARCELAWHLFALVTENRLEPLSPREGLRAILPNILFFSSNKLMTEELLQVLAEASEAIPFYRLHFRKDSTFWSVITP